MGSDKGKHCPQRPESLTVYGPPPAQARARSRSGARSRRTSTRRRTATSGTTCSPSWTSSSPRGPWSPARQRPWRPPRTWATRSWSALPLCSAAVPWRSSTGEPRPPPPPAGDTAPPPDPHSPPTGLSAVPAGLTLSQCRSCFGAWPLKTCGSCTFLLLGSGRSLDMPAGTYEAILETNQDSSGDA